MTKTDNITDLIDRLTSKKTSNKDRLSIAKETLLKQKETIEHIHELKSMAQSNSKYKNVYTALYNELVYVMNGIDAIEKC